MLVISVPVHELIVLAMYMIKSLCHPVHDRHSKCTSGWHPYVELATQYQISYRCPHCNYTCLRAEILLRTLVHVDYSPGRERS